MPKWKKYFNDNKKIMDYLVKIWNENDSDDNIDTDEDSQFN